MRWWLLVALSVSQVATAGPERQVQALLNAWQVDAAAKAVEPLLEALPDLPAIQAAAARVKFHQQRYADAMDLMRRAKAATGREPAMYSLIRETYLVTKDFTEYRDRRAIVRMAPGPDEVLAPYLLAGLNDAIDRLAPRFGLTIDAPLVVEVYPSTKAFSRVSTLDLKSIQTSGTIALCKFDRLMIITPRVTLRGYDWLDTVSHELIHLLISRKSHNTVPVWLHEGLAKYHESGWRKPFGEPLSPRSAGLLARAVNKDELITFEQMSPSMAYLPSQEATATAFAEVHTAIEYLLEMHSDKAILGLLDGLKTSGGNLDRAFRAVTGADLKTFESRWSAWLKKRPFETRDGVTKPAIAFGTNRAAVDDDDPDRPDGEAGRYARLGDLLYRRGHRAAAAIEYERSLKRAGPGYPGLVHRLASCLIAAKKLERAQEVLGQSATRNPDDPRTHVLLGRLAIQSKAYEQALDAYRRANAINPFDPEVHEGMRIAATELKLDEIVTRETRALEVLRREQPATGEKDQQGDVGFLSITSTPWADVLIDDKPLKRATPLTDYPVPVGTRRVTLRNTALSLERSLDVQVVLGKTTTLTVDLKEKP